MNDKHYLMNLLMLENDTDNIIITTTCPNKNIATKIAKLLLTEKRAACVQILPPMESYYIWENKVTYDPEILIFIKTGKFYFKAVEKLILEHHPYDVPQILSLKIDDIHKPYANWLENVINK